MFCFFYFVLCFNYGIKIFEREVIISVKYVLQMYIFVIFKEFFSVCIYVKFFVYVVMFIILFVKKEYVQFYKFYSCIVMLLNSYVIEVCVVQLY